MSHYLISKLVLFGLLLVLSGFFSGSESALFSLGLSRVRRLKKRSQRAFLAAQALLQKPIKLISTLLTGNEFVNSAICVLGTSLVYAFFHNRVDVAYLPTISVAMVLPFLLILGEIVPKTFGIKSPELFVSMTAVPLLFCSKLFSPASVVLSFISHRILSFSSGAPADGTGLSEDIFVSMVDAGHEEGVLDEQERQLIHNVLRLDDIRIRQIMTPVKDVSVMRADMTLTQALKVMKRDRYSRFPVLSGEGEGVVGVLHAKALLGLDHVEKKKTISGYLRPALIVDADINALDLFIRFKNQRTHFAVVNGEADDSILGVVTLEDVLEEIFGAIRDEQDLEEEGQ